MMGRTMRLAAGMVAAVAVMAMAAGTALAQGAPARGGDAAVDFNAAIATYVDAQTILVGHVDLGQVDTAAAEAFVTRMLDAAQTPADDRMRQELAAARAGVDGFLARFKQLGGRHVFLVMAQSDIYPGLSGPALLFRIEPGGDANGMLELFKAMRGGSRAPESIERLGDLVVVAQGAATVERLKQVVPAARPELALSSGAGAPPVELVAALIADQKRVIQELLPAVPPELGGGSSRELVESLAHVRLRAFLPPEPRVELFLAHGSASGASWRRVAERARQEVLASRELERTLEMPAVRARAAEIRKLIGDLLTPAEGTAWGGQTTTFTLTTEQIRGAAGMMLSQALTNARSSANRAASASAIRKVLIGCLSYASEHANRLPAKIADAERYFDKPVAEVMKIPGDAQGRTYVYRAVPGELSKLKNPAATPVVWEPLGGGEGVNVGFVDGHVEYLPQARAEAVIREGAGTQPGLP